MTLQLPPVPAREDLSLMIRWVEETARTLERYFNQGVPALRFKPLYVEPSRPRDGDVVFVAAQVGSSWDPDGSGNGGFFGYYGASWHKLG